MIKSIMKFLFHEIRLKMTNKFYKAYFFILLCRTNYIQRSKKHIFASKIQYILNHTFNFYKIEVRLEMSNT